MNALRRPGLRFLVEAVVIVLTAVVTGLMHLGGFGIGGAVAVVWVIVAVIEYSLSHPRERAEPAPLIETLPEREPVVSEAVKQALSKAVELKGKVNDTARELAQLHPRLRADLLLAAALVHDVGRTRELGPPPVFRPTEEGTLLGHVHLGLRLLETAGAPSELLHAVACHHDARAARTAEAAVLYHANQLDAVAATRPIPE